MKKTVESRVAETILQRKREVTICGETYQVAPPSVATLILVSEAISKLPAVVLDKDKMVTETLYMAKDAHLIGEIVAIMVLGPKNLTETSKVVNKRFFGLIRSEKEEVIDRKKELADKVLLECSPSELSELIGQLLQMLEVAFFFGTTVSLIEINLLRTTREIATTASGR